ncbi:hypothetical protein GTA08_BOTSDO08997 [Botryosphaeria dothidea]|uniref:Uncharacterized protein n=1 Tax=Botryosphaeria dothidea TaxID=55169 RepID=A0A8H4IML8_9PEZI|nr:hypothetical protein GTA08_BOTSDO08997 [Botryosphaeria dothidea]
MTSSSEQIPHGPTLRISTSLSSSVLSVSQTSYPTITLTLTLTLTLHNTTRPLTACTRGGTLDPAGYSERKSPFALVNIRTREHADRYLTVGALQSRDRDITLDARGGDLVTIYPGTPVARTFEVSGYEDTQTRPVEPGEKNWYEWGDMDEALKRHVGPVGRLLGVRKFKTERRNLGACEWKEKEDLVREEGERGRIRLVE